MVKGNNISQESPVGPAGLILRLQPFLTFPVFLYVLLGVTSLLVVWPVAVLPVVIRLIIYRKVSSRTPFDIPVLLYAVGILIGYFISSDRQMAAQILNSSYASILFYYGLVNNGDAPKAYWISIGAFFSMILVILALFMFSGGLAKHVIFNSWVFGLASRMPDPWHVPVHANVVGGSLAVAIPALIGIALSSFGKPVRIVSGITAIAFMVFLALSASSGGWFAAFGGIAFILLFYPEKRYLAAVAVLAMLAGSTFAVWRDASWVQLVFSRDSVVTRIDLWKDAVQVLKTNTLTGLGFGGWWSLVPSFPAQGGWHNAYIQLLSDTGIAGGIALITGAAALVKTAGKMAKGYTDSRLYTVGIGIIGAVVSGAIHACVDVNSNALIVLETTTIYFSIPYLWLLLAILVVVYRRMETA